MLRERACQNESNKCSAKGKKNGREKDYYKKMSERQLKESSHLAEQLICLRSDMEKQSLEIIKQHRQNSSATSSYCTDILALWGEDRTPREIIPKSICSSTRNNRNAKSSLGRYISQQSDSPFESVADKELSTPKSDNKELMESTKSRKQREPPNRPYNFSTHTHSFKA